MIDTIPRMQMIDCTSLASPVEVAWHRKAAAACALVTRQEPAKDEKGGTHLHRSIH